MTYNLKDVDIFEFHITEASDRTDSWELGADITHPHPPNKRYQTISRVVPLVTRSGCWRMAMRWAMTGIPAWTSSSSSGTISTFTTSLRWDFKRASEILVQCTLSTCSTGEIKDCLTSNFEKLVYCCMHHAFFLEGRVDKVTKIK